MSPASSDRPPELDAAPAVNTVAVPPIVPIVDEAASFEVTMLIWPVVLMLACRLFAASAVLSSLSVETCPAPVPKVMLVAVLLPVVAVIVSVSPLSAGGSDVRRSGAQAERGKACPQPAADDQSLRRTRAEDELAGPLTVEAVAAPVMPSIAVKTVCDRRRAAGADADRDVAAAVGRLVVCAVLKVMVFPSTVRIDPLLPGVAASVSEFARGTDQFGGGRDRHRRGQIVILTAVPVTVLLVPGSEQVVRRRAGDGGRGHVGLGRVADRGLQHLVGDRLGAGDQALQRGDAGVGGLQHLHAVADAVEQVADVAGAVVEALRGEVVGRVVERRVDLVAGGEVILGGREQRSGRLQGEQVLAN